MPASPKQGWAAGETDGRRVRLLLLLPPPPLLLQGWGQKAHGNCTITTKITATAQQNLWLSCVFVRDKWQTDPEFQIDLMKCFNFHISNKDSRTSVVKKFDMLTSNDEIFKLFSLLYKDYITGIIIFIFRGRREPSILTQCTRISKQEKKKIYTRTKTISFLFTYIKTHDPYLGPN